MPFEHMCHLLCVISKIKTKLFVKILRVDRCKLRLMLLLTMVSEHMYNHTCLSSKTKSKFWNSSAGLVLNVSLGLGLGLRMLLNTCKIILV